jgi:hypothetical protein
MFLAVEVASISKISFGRQCRVLFFATDCFVDFFSPAHDAKGDAGFSLAFFGAPGSSAVNWPLPLSPVHVYDHVPFPHRDLH